ncbi:ATP-binding protein [Temperatibacter marinus]|uniref:histidine kinase n=1 Tax=Temperatibacter marinus TaxID=1456591 RepID=A0AA52EFZ0_9PROT|nr:ATP-binding protein [Temperatibacter marinus]WND04020.1 ATP-binding protein [Temperatibacter marinus]
MFKNIAFRNLFPLIIMEISIVLVLFFLVFLLPSIHSSSNEFAKSEFENHLSLLQGRINAILGRDELMVRQDIFYTQLDPKMKAVFLLDDSNTILFSHRGIFEGKNISEIDYDFSPEIITSVMKTGDSIVELSQTRQAALGYAGLIINSADQRELYTLLVVKDYSSLQVNIVRLALFPAMLIFGALVFFSVAANWLIRKKFNVQFIPLMNATKELQQGIKNVQVPIKGRDEFASLSRSFNSMTAELSSQAKALEDAKTTAESASAAKSEFLTNMSHEFRTPLTGIIGFLDLLEEENKDPSIEHYIKTANLSAHTLLELINDLLDFSRLEAGQVEVSKASFDLNKLVQDIQAALEPQTLSKSVKVVSNLLPEQHSFINHDQKLLRQCIVNLVGNAIKFTDKGSVRIIMDATPDENGKAEYKIEIIDTGVGISSEGQARLFNRFERVHDTSQIYAQGTGLGLAICAQIAEIIEGHLSVTSSLGEGSAFTLTFDAAIAKQHQKLATTPAFDPGPSQKSLVIAAVDDNAINRMLVTQFIEKWGAKALLFECGEDIIDYAKAEDSVVPDLVLMDINMPGLNGVETQQVLRTECPAYDTLPIIALTANAIKGDREEYIAAGLTDYISKPIDVDKLYFAFGKYTNL